MRRHTYILYELVEGIELSEDMRETKLNGFGLEATKITIIFNHWEKFLPVMTFLGRQPRIK
jgi:hypothetical protein